MMILFTNMAMSFKLLLSTCNDIMILKNFMLTLMMSLNNLLMILKNLMSITMMCDDEF